MSRPLPGTGAGRAAPPHLHPATTSTATRADDLPDGATR
jgi:hypothetical protein